MNWSEILRKGGVPEPPGYIETVAKVSAKPKRQKKSPRANGKKSAPLWIQTGFTGDTGFPEQFM